VKNRILATIAGIALLAGASGTAIAGKSDGSKCVNSKSCSSKVCDKAPGEKFGTCCVRDSCASLGAHCGFVDNGCGVELHCGDCAEADDCNANVCEPSLVCGWPDGNTGIPEGGYRFSCSDCSVTDCTLSCTCLEADQDPNFTTLDLTTCDPDSNSIQNFNGILTCDPLPVTSTSTTMLPTTTLSPF
jgi:hypothetical protein